MGLHRAGVNVLGREDVLIGEIRILEPLLDIAFPDLGMGDDVGPRVGGERALHLVFADVLVDQGRARLHRLERIGDLRQLFVFDIDQVDGLAGNFFACRGYRRHRFTSVANYPPGEERLVANRRAEPVRYVLAGDHRAHPPLVARAAGIDGDNPGMRVRRTQYLGK